MSAIPERPEELEDMLLDERRTGELLRDKEKFQEVIKGYAQRAMKDGELGKQVQEQVDARLKEWEDKHGLEKGSLKRLPMSPKAAAPTRMGNIDPKLARQVAAYGVGPGVEFDGKWETAGKFVIDATRKDMSEGDWGGGGALLPEEFRVELLMLALENAIVRPRATVIPMTSATLRYPAIKDTTHASTVYGGVSAAWIGEGASLATTTQPTFSGVRLTPKKLTGHTVASNELRQDSPISMDALVLSLWPNAIAYFEDDAFIMGTGVGQPEGVNNATALVTVAKETGQVAATIVYDNIVKMFARMHPASLGRSVWLANSDIFPQLAKMALNVGTGGSAVWLSNIVGGYPATILGRPLILTEKCQTLGAAGDLMFVDLGMYLIGDRMALSVMSSPIPNYATDQMTYWFVQRVDGKPWLQSALTPRRSSATVSAFVNLATRA